MLAEEASKDPLLQGSRKQPGLRNPTAQNMGMLNEIITGLARDENIEGYSRARRAYIYGGKPIGRGKIVHVHEENDLGLKTFK